MVMFKTVLFVLLVSIIFTMSAGAQEILEAAKKGDIKKTKSLIEKDMECIKTKDNAGRTALHFAANSGHSEIVKYLLSKGVDKNLTTNANTTPLHYAALNGHLGVVRLLVKNGANLELKNNQTTTPLYYAAMRGFTDVLKYLAESGAVIDALDAEQGTPLHAAAQSGHFEVVQLLIEKGAEKKKKDINGLTALHFACRNGKKETITFLLNCGLEMNDPDLYGKNPLYYAVESGHKEAVNLLSSDAINEPGRVAANGNTYLHAAATGGLDEFAEKLLSMNVNVNSRNIYGKTPLTIAAKNGKKELEDLLVKKGAIKENEKSSIPNGNYLGQKSPGMAPEIFAPGIISTEDLNERDVSFSRDGKEFFFSQWGGGKPFNIMYMKQENSQWTEPQQVSFSGQYQDAEAYFTPDEKKIFFISNRPKSGTGNPETWEIWFVEREGKDWGIPQLLGSPFEGAFYTTFTKTWNMYYTQHGDLYRSKYTNTNFAEPQRLGENVNTEEGEYNSFIAPDESYLIFTSIRAENNYGEGDLYICFRKDDGSWTKAINLGPEINSFARDYCPSISPDGKYFFFSSRKFGTEDIFWIDAKVIENLNPK